MAENLKGNAFFFTGEAREMKINKAPTANSSPWLIIGIMSGAAVILVILVFVIYKCVKTRQGGISFVNCCLFRVLLLLFLFVVVEQVVVHNDCASALDKVVVVFISLFF